MASLFSRISSIIFIALGWLSSAGGYIIRTPMRMLTGSGGMKALPANVVKYSQVPKEGFFVKGKIPRGLLKEHTTKSGTWGVIRVSEGQLEYQINEPSVEKYVLKEGTPGVIEPQIRHQVTPLTDDVKFVVEFHRAPGSGPVDEKREGL